MFKTRYKISWHYRSYNELLYLYKKGVSANYYRMVGVEKIYDLYDDYRCTSEWRRMTRRMARVRHKAHLRDFINEYKYNKYASLCI